MWKGTPIYPALSNEGTDTVIEGTVKYKYQVTSLEWVLYRLQTVKKLVLISETYSPKNLPLCLGLNSQKTENRLTVFPRLLFITAYFPFTTIFSPSYII